MCAFAGTGNVLRVQTMLQQCGEHLNAKEAAADPEQEGEKKAETRQDDTSKHLQYWELHSWPWVRILVQRCLSDSSTI